MYLISFYSQELISSLKKYKIALLVLLAGIGLMLLPTGRTPTENPAALPTQPEVTLQESLEAILSQIAGAGEVRVLLTALETGTLTAAAEKLDYTPSGISRSIAALEEETGFALLLRSRNGVTPTKACREMLPVFGELLRCEERCRQRSGEIQGLEMGEIAVEIVYCSYNF